MRFKTLSAKALKAFFGRIIYGILNKNASTHLRMKAFFDKMIYGKLLYTNNSLRNNFIIYCNAQQVNSCS